MLIEVEALASFHHPLVRQRSSGNRQVVLVLVVVREILILVLVLQGVLERGEEVVKDELVVHRLEVSVVVEVDKVGLLLFLIVRTTLI